MTRAELVTRYNENVEKRNHYMNKQIINSSLKNEITQLLGECAVQSQIMFDYSHKAKVFEQLYEKNTDRFCNSKYTCKRYNKFHS